MVSHASHPHSIVGRRIKGLREELGWSQEKIGVAIGIDESSSRARISRYELGVHEPPLPTARLIAHAMGAPLLAGPVHALVLIYLTSANRFSRRQAAASVGMPPAGRKGRNRAG